jgi:hypothetical protein
VVEESLVRPGKSFSSAVEGVKSGPAKSSMAKGKETLVHEMGVGDPPQTMVLEPSLECLNVLQRALWGLGCWL